MSEEFDPLKQEGILQNQEISQNLNKWIEEQAEKARAAKTEREQRQYEPVPRSAMKQPNVLDRWAEVYGTLVKDVKRFGHAKINAATAGNMSAKTFAARLRDIRSAVAEDGYTSDHIPADAAVIMKDKVFRETGIFVKIQDSRKSIAAVVESMEREKPPYVITTIQEAEAMKVVLGLKDENGDVNLSKVVLAVTDPALFNSIVELFRLAGFTLEVEMHWIAVTFQSGQRTQPP